MQKIDQPALPRRRGRPRDPRRCKRILESARDHFLAQGLEGANMDAIASDAGVSKMTVYSHFASKETLFEAVVRDRTDQVVGGIAGVEAMDPEFPQQALMTIGEQFLALARDERELGQFRALYGAAGTQPLACQAFYRQGAERLVADLASYLDQATEAFTLSVADPRLAADLFLAMFLGEGHIRGLLKLPMPAAEENRALLREAVRVFLAAYENKGWQHAGEPARHQPEGLAQAGVDRPAGMKQRSLRSRDASPLGVRRICRLPNAAPSGRRSDGIRVGCLLHDRLRDEIAVGLEASSLDAATGAFTSRLDC